MSTTKAKAPFSVFAPAKVNLALHITGRRPDGYHALESLVAFASVGDSLAIAPASAFSFSCAGPFADSFSKRESGPDNIVVRAAGALATALGKDMPAAQITLTKNLPLASGIGGGSADAAATLRGLIQWWALAPGSVPDLMPLMTALGADVPVCLASHPARMEGIGDILKPLSRFPALPVVLVNPLKPCDTARVFRGYQGPFRSPAPWPGDFPDSSEFISFLKERHNDLTNTATEIVPEIGSVLAALEENAPCRLARMSGSGATCFGLFPDQRSAQEAAQALAARHPEWWVVSGTLAPAA
ncbi:MAG: 4-(cytidine 5'-diphospho)-2-C-methyl-D-erythritol kinase [Alphaproteobacteria bacterium]|nr:4-(cytidine 5'-diphospho)-2-C-methyl-D-erythritol kinase [Alphaproteobacteria bacterium]